MAVLSVAQPCVWLSPGLNICPLKCKLHRSSLGTINITRLVPLKTNALLNPQDDPIVKEAFKEPLAFLGGVFAGVLRLDMNEDPLREWVAKTSQAAGVQDVEEVEIQEETPEEIQID